MNEQRIGTAHSADVYIKRFSIGWSKFLLHCGLGYCKEQLPAPGNRSNERRYREKDLATTEGKKVGTGEKREGDEKSRGREK
ncbi:hypothetical protein TNCV_782041 [Trichonephila clavipes]|nr:hypothetical protein TNCV_782041 [Trichonephila clavipes]